MRFDVIETRTSEKQLPAQSKPLGFNCISCGRDHGSIQFLKRKTREIQRKRRGISSKRNEVEAIRIPKRLALNPVEYYLRNAIIVRAEEKLLDKATKDLAELRRNGWRLLPLSPPLPESEREMLESFASQLKSRIEARKQLEEERVRKESVWNIIEKVEDIDPFTYDLMKKLGRGIIIITEKPNENEEEGEKGEINNSNQIIKWNPITLIRKYRRSGDPFRHLDFPMRFYAKVLAKHYYIYTKYLSVNDEKVLRRAFGIVNKYRKQFSDRNYRYTWYEWFWIVRYAQAFTPRRAAKMLLALDGEEGGRISPKRIKDQMKPVMKFLEDYLHYSPYFFNFVKLMYLIIEKDPELKAENSKMLEQDREENEKYRKEILEEHLEKLLQEHKHNATDNNNDDYYLGTNNDDFKAAKIGPERVRIHHSNPNYQKETEEFKNGLRKEKPKKKTSCTFSPSLLPIDTRIKLHKEGKIPII